MDEEGGFDCFGADDPDYVGFEYMDLAKAGTGLLSGFGSMFSGGGSGGGAQPQLTAAQAAERQRLEEEKKRAEQSATNTKIALGVVGGVTFVGLVTALVMRR